MKRKINYLIFVIVVIILIMWSNYSNKKSCLKFGNDLTFNGVVLKKYIDHKRHDYPIVQIRAFDTSSQEINFILDYSGFFDYIQNNDSIVKKNNDLNVFIYREHFDTSFLLKINCN